MTQSAYEKDRIIPQSFGLTEMGRDLLAEDYMLKQITASLIYPEGETGMRFWKRVYAEAAQKFGTTNIPVNTFNKVWIVPEKAVVYENAKTGTAYVVESRLKVMVEEDYLSLEKHKTSHDFSALRPQKDVNSIGSQVIREIVIPELTKEVNEDKNFSQLRQVYNSLILATWYKKKIKDSILEQVYADKNKVVGVNTDDPQEKQKIYERYLQAFKKGVYNFIKEEPGPVSGQTLPRKYFSGGVNFNLAMLSINNQTPNLGKWQKLKLLAMRVVLRTATAQAMGYAPEDLAMVHNKGDGATDVDNGLPILLNKSIERMAGAAQSQEVQHSGLPIDELILYLRVLRDMYADVVEKYSPDSFRKGRAAFAVQLAYLPNFQAQARQMLDESLAGIRREYGEVPVYGVAFMMNEISYIITEAARHPEFRQEAMELIDNPQSYGLPVSLDQSNSTRASSKTTLDLTRHASIVGWEHTLESASQVLIMTAKKGHYDLTDRVKDIIYRRERRLLDFADQVVHEDPLDAEAAVKEFLRLWEKYGDVSPGRAHFIFISYYQNIMASKAFRPRLIQMAQGLKELNRDWIFIAIAGQTAKEGNAPQALELLEGVRMAAFEDFETLVGAFHDLIILVFKNRDRLLVRRLETLISSMSDSEGKMGLLVDLGNAYGQLNMEQEAGKYYQDAWRMSEKMPHPAVIRFNYFVPLMRQKRIQFPLTREDILGTIRRLAEEDILNSSPEEDPYSVTQKMQFLAREYALNRDYKLAEDAVRFVHDHVDNPQGTCDRMYAIIWMAALSLGDTHTASFLRSKIIGYLPREEYYQAAKALVDHGEYKEAMDLIGPAELSVKIQIARYIMDRDETEAEMIKAYVLNIAQNIGYHEEYFLDCTVNLVSTHPAIDPDGHFIIQVFNLVYEKFKSIKHNDLNGNVDFYRTTLQHVRQMIILRSRKISEKEESVTDLFREAQKLLPGQEANDSAQIVPKHYGGIDLTPVNMNVQTRHPGGVIKFHLDPAMLARLKDAPGFVPVIIDIQPMTDLRQFLGLNLSESRPMAG